MRCAEELPANRPQAARFGVLTDWVNAFLQRERLPDTYRHTIDAALVPLAEAIGTRARQSDHMVLVGLCGAQGSGKSTAAAALVELLARQDLPAVALSIDDFYLPRAERATPSPPRPRRRTRRTSP